MSGIATAIIGGAVIGGAVSYLGAKKGADAQTQAAGMSIEEQRREYDINQANLAPFRQAGLSVLPQITAGLRPGGDFNRDFTLADFNKDPGYQFRMDQGQRALEASAAARGGLLGGGTLKALSRYGQDYASNEYSNAYNRFNNDRTTRFNRLSAVAGTGQTATNTLANLGTQTAQNIGETYLGAGNARAAGYIGGANAINQGVGSLANFYLQQQYMNRFAPLPAASPGTTGGGAGGP